MLDEYEIVLDKVFQKTLAWAYPSDLVPAEATAAAKERSMLNATAPEIGDEHEILSTYFL